MANTDEFNPEAVIDDYFSYVQQYRLVSASLPAEGALFPNQQVRGLLIELALKTYLCATGIDERGHDLCSLTEYAKRNGLSVTEDDLNNTIKPLNDIYFEGGPWEHRYLCRYPKPNRGTLVTVTPTHDMVDDLVGRIINQATELRKA